MAFIAIKLYSVLKIKHLIHISNIIINLAHNFHLHAISKCIMYELKASKATGVAWIFYTCVINYTLNGDFHKLRYSWTTGVTVTWIDKLKQMQCCKLCSCNFGHSWQPNKNPMDENSIFSIMQHMLLYKKGQYIFQLHMTCAAKSDEMP